jgi:hypothetical protein
LWVLCVVRMRSLPRIDHSSRGVLPTVARRCVRSRNFEKEEAKARYRAVKIQPQWVVTPGKQTNKQTNHWENCNVKWLLSRQKPKWRHCEMWRPHSDIDGEWSDAVLTGIQLPKFNMVKQSSAYDHWGTAIV